MSSCVYCLANERLRKEQVLLKGSECYLCAPLGQIVEGYLVVAPYRCIGTISELSSEHCDEIERLVQIVKQFYAQTYKTADITIYEQGRAGGGASTVAANGFPSHAHLCALPRAVDLHAHLAPDFTPHDVSGLGGLPEVTNGEPYVYVECMGKRSVYLASTDDGRERLAKYRLKPEIATYLGTPERGDWRACPGHSELESLTNRWRSTCLTQALQI